MIFRKNLRFSKTMAPHQVKEFNNKFKTLITKEKEVGNPNVDLE